VSFNTYKPRRKGSRQIQRSVSCRFGTLDYQYFGIWKSVEEFFFGNRESQNIDKRRKNLEHWITGNEDVDLA
jgi:hypothetical protein